MAGRLAKGTTTGDVLYRFNTVGCIGGGSSMKKYLVAAVLIVSFATPPWLTQFMSCSILTSHKSITTRSLGQCIATK